MREGEGLAHGNRKHVRLEVVLDGQEERYLEANARARGLSKASVIRELIRLYCAPTVLGASVRPSLTLAESDLAHARAELERAA